MKLYFKYMKVHFMSQMSYKKSFFLLNVGQFLVPFTTLFALVILFQRFDNIKGWTLPEALLCYAVINLSYSISEFLARGFDAFRVQIREGTFDRLLLRPRHTILQVFGSKFDFTRLGRAMNGLIALMYALSLLHQQMTAGKYITLLLMICSGIIIFTGLFILGAALCFKTIQGLEVINIFTDGGREMGSYPLDIYRGFIRRFFTFVVPFALVNYYPLLYVLGKTHKITYALSPILSVFFLIPCYFIWQRGVKHYTSTGS